MVREKESILLPASRRPCIQSAFANWSFEFLCLLALSLEGCDQHLSPCGQHLTLAELEALPRSLLPVLLAFSHARITREEAVLPQSMPQVGIQNRKRA